MHDLVARLDRVVAFRSVRHVRRASGRFRYQFVAREQFAGRYGHFCVRQRRPVVRLLVVGRFDGDRHGGVRHRQLAVLCRNRVVPGCAGSELVARQFVCHRALARECDAASHRSSDLVAADQSVHIILGPALGFTGIRECLVLGRDRHGLRLDRQRAGLGRDRVVPRHVLFAVHDLVACLDRVVARRGVRYVRRASGRFRHQYVTFEQLAGRYRHFRVRQRRPVVRLLVVGSLDGDRRGGVRHRQLAVRCRNGVVPGCAGRELIARDLVLYRALARERDAAGDHCRDLVAADQAVHVILGPALRLARVHERLVLRRDCHSLRLDDQLRGRRRNSAVVRVRSFYIDRVLARIGLRQASQIVCVGPGLLKAVAICRRSRRGRAARCLCVVLRGPVIGVRVIGQADREPVVTLRDRQCAVLQRDHVVCGIGADRHAVLGDLDVIIADFLAFACQLDRRDALTVDQAAFRDRVVRLYRIVCRRIGDRASRVLARRVVRLDRDRPRRDRHRAVSGRRLVVGVLRLYIHGLRRGHVCPCRSRRRPRLVVRAVGDRRAFRHRRRRRHRVRSRVIRRTVGCHSKAQLRRGSLRDRKRYGRAGCERHVKVAVIVGSLRDVDSFGVIADVFLSNRRRAGVAEFARVEQAVAAARRHCRFGCLVTSVVDLRIGRTVDRDLYGLLVDRQDDIRCCRRSFDHIACRRSGNRCRNCGGIGPDCRSFCRNRIYGSSVLLGGDSQSDSGRQGRRFHSCHLIFNGVIGILLFTAVIGLCLRGTCYDDFNICGPDRIQVIVAERCSRGGRGIHGADEHLFAYRELNGAVCCLAFIAVPANQRIAGAGEGISRHRDGITAASVVPNVSFAAVVINIGVSVVCGMIRDLSLRDRGVVYRRQLDDQLAINSGEEFFIFKYEGVPRPVQIALGVLPSNELLIGGRCRSAGEHGNASVLDVLIVIHESAGAAVEIIHHSDSGTQAPLCGQVENIVIVPIRLIIERAFVTKILGDRIREIPGVSVRIEPADQSMIRSGRILHV